MQIDLRTINLEQFNVNPHMIGDEVCYLVTPKHVSVDWTQETKIFRSSLWNSKGELISASFPKFVNYGEKPAVFPPPKNLNNATIVTKLDGSTLIVSKYNNYYIIRTRGTVDASKLDNGHEIEIFKSQILNSYLERYPDNTNLATWPYSIIFEWTSPNNKIILDYGDKPNWHLIGWIGHINYDLLSQKGLDIIASKENWIRPQTYLFVDLVDLVENVDKWKDKEGVCLYYNEDQSITKIKAASYLLKHRFKENATLENTIDLFFDFGMPAYQEFEKKLIEKFDFECFEMVRGYISNICDGYKEVYKVVNGMTIFVNETVKQLPNRKEQALKILSSYGQTNRSGFVFQILDGKSLDKESLKKILYQCLKK